MLHSVTALMGGNRGGGVPAGTTTAQMVALAAEAICRPGADAKS